MHTPLRRRAVARVTFSAPLSRWSLTIFGTGRTVILWDAPSRPDALDAAADATIRHLHDRSGCHRYTGRIVWVPCAGTDRDLIGWAETVPFDCTGKAAA